MKAKYPTFSKLRKFKVVKSANLSDLNPYDKKNLLKFATSKIDSSSIKSQAAQALAELKKKKQNDKKAVANKDKGKVRQQNNYSVIPIRPQIPIAQMNMI